MKKRSSTVQWVVVLMAFSSLLTMICLLQIDKLVHGTLYEYGLTFNTQWAVPYWTKARIAFAMGWINIIAAIAVHLYSVAFRQKEVEQLITDVQKEIEQAPQLTPTTEQPQKTEAQKQPEPQPQPMIDKKEETKPILPGVPEEEIPQPPPIPEPEKTPQQVAPAAA